MPTEETERNRWLAAISRDNIPDSKDTVVCERHWPQNHPQIIVRGKSEPSTPPSVFRCVPPSLLPPLYHPIKKKACSAAREEVFDEMLKFDSKDRIIGFKDINLALCIRLYYYALMTFLYSTQIK